MKSTMLQRHFSRRDFLRISGLTGLSVGLAACTPSAPGEQPAAGAAESAAPAGEGVSLRWVTNHSSVEIPNFEKVAQNFMDNNPNVTIELLNVPGEEYYNSINTQGIGGSLPDIFYTRTFDVVPFASKGWTVNLQPLVDRDQELVNVDDFWPAEVEQMVYEGDLYALPYDFSNIGIVFNKDMLDEAGVSVPEDGNWNWQDCFDMAGQLVQKDGDITTRWGMAVYPWSWVWIGILFANGGKLFSDDYKTCIIDSPENRETFDFFVKQREAGIYPEAGALPQGVDPFASGLIAMAFEGSWATQGRRESVGDKFVFDVTYFPNGTTGSRAISAAGGAWGIGTNSQAVEEAWQFNVHLTSTESTDILISEPVRSIPGRQSSVPAWNDAASRADLPPEHVEVFGEQMQDAWAQPFPIYWKDFDVAWTNRIVPLLNGGEAETNVSDILAQFQEEVNGIIAQSGA